MNNDVFKNYIIVNNIETEDDNLPITNMEVSTIKASNPGSFTTDGRKLIGKKIIKKYVANKGDILFFHSECTIPRFKLKTFCDKHGVSISKTAEKANIMFISTDLLDKLINCERFYAMNVSDYIKVIHAIYPKDSSKGAELLNQLETYTEDIVLFDYYNAYFNVNDHILLKDIFDTEKDDEYFYTLKSTKDLNIDIINDPKIRMEDDVIKYINIGNEMDEESYNNVRSLFESTDNGNHMLAMEIMANCDYIKSAVYLLLLFEEFKGEIYNSPSRRHVNFKSFTKFFSLDASRHFSMTDILFTLKKNNLATPENLNMVIKSKKEELVHPESSEHFEVQIITPNNESKEAIVSSIINEAVENNTPYSEEEIKSKVDNLVFKLD